MCIVCQAHKMACLNFFEKYLSVVCCSIDWHGIFGVPIIYSTTPQKPNPYSTSWTCSRWHSGLFCLLTMLAVLPISITRLVEENNLIRQPGWAGWFEATLYARLVLCKGCFFYLLLVCTYFFLNKCKNSPVSCINSCLILYHEINPWSRNRNRSRQQFEILFLWLFSWKWGLTLPGKWFTWNVKPHFHSRQI